MPDGINPPGIRFWRRPTLARPIAVLPSGLQRFTAVFGMGTGGATALLSPVARAGPANCGASHRERPTRISGDGGVRRGGRPIISLRGQRPRLQHFQKNMISNPQSQIENPKFLLVLWYLHTGFRKIPRSATEAITFPGSAIPATTEFWFEIICLLC